MKLDDRIDNFNQNTSLYPFLNQLIDYAGIFPPPIHQMFEGHNFVICSFVPRLYDYHPDAIPAPYYHT